VAKDP